MNRQKIQILPLFLFLIVISITLLVLDKNRITYPIRSVFEQYLLNIRGTDQSTVENTEELKTKIISLENERDDLTDENRALRKQLQAPLPPSYQFIPSIVLEYAVDEQKSELFISGGTDEGVEIGMPVVTENILIGTIIGVSPKTSHVRLLSDPASSITIKTSSNARGIIFGSENNDASQGTLDRILRSETVLAGDRVESSGEDEIPADLLIGEISELLTESRDPFQKARVNLTVDPKTLLRVFVIYRE